MITLLIALAGLPNPLATPGAINHHITQANAHNSVCYPGYTKMVRPPARFTNALKKAQLADGAYKDTVRLPAFYEEDHLIPLELGGAPRDPHNLWPQPWNETYGAHVKDKCEDAAHTLVCRGKVSLAEAQRGFAKDWIGYCRSLGVIK